MANANCVLFVEVIAKKVDMLTLGCVHLEQMVETDEETSAALADRHLFTTLDNIHTIFAQPFY